MKFVSNSERETLKFAQELAKKLRKGVLILLSGPLGAGKTQFVKGLAQGLGIKEPVTSPSFVIMNEYRGVIPLFHIDLYRLNGFPQEDIDLDELLEEGIVAIEWWEKDSKYFQRFKNIVTINIKILDESKREINIDEDME